MPGSTLVLDIGKSNARLVLIDAQAEVLRATSIANAPEQDHEHGYLALGVKRLESWLLDGVPALLQGFEPDRISVTTHGAAFCALGADGLVLPPIDYEWDGYGDTTAAFDASLANFAHHGTPLLGQGLNGGRQIDHVHRRWPRIAERIQYWVPYPQYWSWWFSGVACTEVSSLGCHTGLWSPSRQRYSDWAIARGIARRFAPMRAAWDVIGVLRPELARRWGLPAGVEIVAGAHDSNACLARYLPQHPSATILSTGTWCVAMAPGGMTSRLAPQRDELVNVAVDGRAVPTARFMGGREFARLSEGCDPALATLPALGEVLQGGWTALPSFATGSGPMPDRQGRIVLRGQTVPGGVAAVPVGLRAALAALYCADMSALLIEDIRPAESAEAPVIVEGPLAANAAYLAALACALQPRSLHRSADRLEGTARGAWMLAWWPRAATANVDMLQAVTTPGDELENLLRQHRQRFREALAST
ncbi:MAG: FGGY-family carbohydrate kinase [Vitreoscilla sp.]